MFQNNNDDNKSKSHRPLIKLQEYENHYVETKWCYKNSISKQQDTQLFQMVGCVCGFDGTIYIKGRKEDGSGIGVEVSDFAHYFYVSRQTPFKNDDDIEKFVDMLEDFAATHTTFRSANFYGAKNPWEMTSMTKTLPKFNNNPKRYEETRMISAYKLIKNVHKDFFGWKPKDCRETVLKLYVTKPYFAKRIYEFLESEEFLKYYADRCMFDSMYADRFSKEFMLKTYQATIDPAFNFRMNTGLTTCKWVSLDRYAPLSTFNANIWSDFNASCTMFDLKARNDIEYNAPLLRMGYDIECAGKIMETGEPRFPVPLWTINQLQSYAKDQLGLEPDGDKKVKKPTRWKRMLDQNPNPSEWIHWIREKLKKLPVETLKGMMELTNRTHLEQFVPKITDTDPVIIIACPLHRDGVDDKDRLEFFEKVIFVYQPRGSPLVKKLSKADYGCEVWKMDEIQCRVYRSEAKMICSFIEYRRKISPDVLDSWNGKSFDEVYLWDRLKYLQQYGTLEEQNMIDKLGNTFGLVKCNKSVCREFFKKTKGGGEFFIRCVSTDLLLQNDGLEVAKHPSYGDSKRKVFTLDAVAMDTLVYSSDSVDQVLDGTIDLLSNYKDKLEECDVTNDVNMQPEISPDLTQDQLKNRMLDNILDMMKGINMADVLPSSEDANVQKEEMERKQHEQKIVKLREMLKERLMGFQLRKMQFEIKEGTAMWKRGGTDLWRFAIYCYIDACLPVLLGGKLTLQLALAKATNVGLDEVMGKGTQLKTMHLYYAQCHESEERYLMPDQSHHYFHWPGIFHDKQRGVWQHLKENLRLRPNKLPEKSTKKNYMGARVIDPVIFGLIRAFTGTLDFSGLYPSIMMSFYLCYTVLLNRYTISMYNMKRYEYSEHVLGPDDVITCGESLFDPKLAVKKGYKEVKHLKVARFHQSKTTVTRELLIKLANLRGVAKKKLAQYKSSLTQLKEYARENASHPNFDINAPIPKTAKVKGKPLTLSGICSQQWEEGKPFRDIKRTAEILTTVYDEEQLAMKLCGNGSYGATAVNDLESYLPCMEMGAAVTAMGRYLLALSKAIAQSTNGNICHRFITAKKHYLELTGKEDAKFTEIFENDTEEEVHLPNYKKRKRSVYDLQSLLNIPQKVYVREAEQCFRSDGRQCIIGGDTDSVMILLTSSELGDDHKKTKYACDTNRYIGYVINQYQGDRTYIVHEKVCYPFAVRAKKNYSMQTPDEYNNGETFGLLLKGKKGDTIPFTHVILAEVEAAYQERPDYVTALDTVVAIIREYRNVSIVVEMEMDGELVISKDDQLKQQNERLERMFMREVTTITRDTKLQVPDKVKIIKALGRQMRKGGVNSTYQWMNYMKRVMEAVEKDDVGIKCIKLVGRHMEDYYKREIDPFMLTTTKKIRKMHYDGNNEAFSVVLKKKSRGEPFSPGSKITYLYVEKPLDPLTVKRYANLRTKTDYDNIRPKNFKGFELTEDYYYVMAQKLPIDLWYTYAHKIRDPVVSYLRHILCPLSDYPYVNKETMSASEILEAEKRQKDVSKLQDEYVRDLLFGDFERKMMEREKRRVMNAVASYQITMMKQAPLFSNGQTTRVTECTMCFSSISLKFRINSKDMHDFDRQGKCPKPVVCEGCKSNKDTLIVSLTEKMKKCQMSREETIFSCKACLLLADAPDMNPDDCKSIECKTYKKKKTVAADMVNIQDKMDALELF